MIVRILSSGSSFKGLATYLTHDPKAKTAERVGWTHTLNLANDHALSAVDEMLWTARNAELLKMEAGIRGGGRVTENPVKHLSLNWAPDQNPDRDHMVETAEDFLRHMNWQDHQALLVAHTDRHSHVHVMLNTVHPETGLKLDEGFERRRAQEWALGYERDNGRIYCEQRLADVAEREDAPTRPAWQAFKNQQIDFDRQEKSRRDQDPILIDEPENAKNPTDDEWKILKNFQREERQDFFADGKAAFSEVRLLVYREVREEFRERWSGLYAAQRDGNDPEALASLKAELVAEQKELLAARRDEACGELRESRNDQYRELLDDQREMRHGLRWRQEAGLDNALFLDRLQEGRNSTNVSAAFGEAAEQATAREGEDGWTASSFAPAHAPKTEHSGMRSGEDVGAGLTLGLGFGLLSFIGGIADGLVPSKPDPRPRQPEPEPVGSNPFREAAVDAHQQMMRDQQEEDDERRRRERADYGERA